MAPLEPRSSDRPARHCEPGLDSDAAYVLSRDEIRQLDALATSEFGIPSIVLMENAARALADEAMQLLANAELRKVVIFAGPGNNGGDGFAAARFLSNARYDVRVCLAADPERVKGDAAINLSIARSMGIGIEICKVENLHEVIASTVGDAPESGLVIDALLGTGITRTPESPIKELIEQINGLKRSGWVVLAADVPSGLDVDTGEALGAVVQADTTVTFAALKPALIRDDASRCCGRVVVGDIGAPRELLERLGRRI